MGLGRVRTWLVADPDASPDLVEFVSDLLVTGGSGVRGLGSVPFDQAKHYEELVRLSMSGEGPVAVPERAGEIGTDVVVLLRTEAKPSREVQTASRVARDLGKPVHVLVAPGVSPRVEADEVHEVNDEPGWEQLQELRRWAISLPERYGPDFLKEGGA